MIIILEVFKNPLDGCLKKSNNYSPNGNESHGRNDYIHVVLFDAQATDCEIKVQTLVEIY